MNLSQVEAFRAVVLSGSTTAAARVLHTSQSNVSRLISQFEKTIGLRLFDRSPGKLTLTQEGQVFFEEVRRSFVGLQQLDEMAAKMRRFGTGLLRIAAIQTIALGMLPRAIKRFSLEHPDVGLSIHTGHSTTIAQWVDARFCDMGIVSLISHDNYSSEPEVIYQTEGVCMMHAGHRLCRKEVITPADLEGEAFISLSQQDELRKPVDRIFEEAGVTRRINIETPYSSIICSLVALDLGVSIVNPLVAQDYRHVGLVSRPFRPAVLNSGILIVPKDRPLSRLAAKFRQVLRDVALEECAALPKY